MVKATTHRLNDIERAAREKLHVVVGATIAIAAFAVTATNAAFAPPEYAADPVRLLLAPQVGLVAVTGILALVTTISTRLRWVQVALLLLTGVKSSFEGSGADLVGFIWLLVGLRLAWEYGLLLNRSRVRAGIIVGAFLAAWSVGILVTADAEVYRVVVNLIMAALLSTLGWLLIVLKHRVHESRQAELEESVAHRTDALANALSEQKLLLAELHHRTKNNLQLVSSMLGFEGDTIERATDPEAVRAAQMRIHALGRVHELLYAASGRNEIDIARFVNDYLDEASLLVESQGLAIERRIEIGQSVRNDLAIRFGLILNEIVLNTMEHASAVSAGCTIGVSVRRQDDNLVLEACDDGPGIELDAGDRVGLGMTIIESMSSRLGGSAVLDSRKGTAWNVTLLLDRNESQWD